MPQRRSAADRRIAARGPPVPAARTRVLMVGGEGDVAAGGAFRALRRRLYVLSFVDEFGPLYAVFTLWLNDNGITAAQISTLFLVWAAVSLVLEVPSGALADIVDRRQLLAVAFALRAAGIALWLVWPTLTGVVVGVALWAMHDALASGSWEAMIHDQLGAIDRAGRYGPVMARIGQFSHLGIAVGTVLGAGLLAAGAGLVALGWITVAVHGLAILLVARLVRTRAGEDQRHAPEQGGRPGEVTADDRPSWWSTLRAGMRDASRSVRLVGLIATGALIEGLFVFDDYIPLLTRIRGGSDATAPLVVLTIWIGLLIGGEIAARWPDLSGGALGLALLGALAATGVALASDDLWPLALVSAGSAGLQATWVITDARTQRLIDNATRATVTSVRGFVAAATAMAAFAAIGATADGDDPTPGLLGVVAVLAVVAVLLIGWLPSAAASKGSPPEPRSNR